MNLNDIMRQFINEVMDGQLDKDMEELEAQFTTNEDLGQLEATMEESFEESIDDTALELRQEFTQGIQEVNTKMDELNDQIIAIRHQLLNGATSKPKPPKTSMLCKPAYYISSGNLNVKIVAEYGNI